MGPIARGKGKCKTTKQNDEKKPEGSVELVLDNLDGVSGAGGSGAGCCVAGRSEEVWRAGSGTILRLATYKPIDEMSSG